MKLASRYRARRGTGRMTILGFLADTSGCGTYRMSMPLAQLAAAGHRVTIVRPDHPYDFTRVPPPVDIIVGQRVSNAGISAEWQRLAAVEGRRFRLVCELDDDLWHMDPANKPAWNFYAKDPARLARAAENIKVADLVTVTTEALAAVVRQWNPRVAVLPNYIDESVFAVRRPPTAVFTAGFGGSISHAGDWQYSGKSISQFLARNPGTEFRFVGGDLRPLLPRSVAAQVALTPWVDRPGEYFRSLVMDVGVAPLRPTAFNRSKSSLKVLEYSALGIPCVAAAYEPYQDFVEHGVTGYLAKGGEWPRYLEMLYRNPGLRARMAAAAVEVAREHTIQAHAIEWQSAYESIL
jgi:glycosyltransferase involved in cell wall biosynthesis